MWQGWNIVYHIVKPACCMKALTYAYINWQQCFTCAQVNTLASSMATSPPWGQGRGRRRKSPSKLWRNHCQVGLHSFGDPHCTHRHSRPACTLCTVVAIGPWAEIQRWACCHLHHVINSVSGCWLKNWAASPVFETIQLESSARHNTAERFCFRSSDSSTLEPLF